MMKATSRTSTRSSRFASESTFDLSSLFASDAHRYPTRAAIRANRLMPVFRQRIIIYALNRPHGQRVLKPCDFPKRPTGRPKHKFRMLADALHRHADWQ